jgi:hypothetical protein
MKNCTPGCEFLRPFDKCKPVSYYYCNLHEEKLDYVKIESKRKIIISRCRKCEQEKEVLDIIQDLDSLTENSSRCGWC